MKKLVISFMIFAALTAMVALSGAACRSSRPATSQSSANNSPAAPASKQIEPASKEIRTNIGFASRDKFVEHYEKHGREFGSISKEEYLRLAQTLRDRPAGGDMLEAVRADGVITRFDRASGAFIAFNPDQTIRTCFKPSDGEAYFRRQSKRTSR